MVSRLLPACSACQTTHHSYLHEHSGFSRASRRHADRRPIVLEELSGVRERAMIIPMPTRARPQQRYDHRLRSLVQRTGAMTVATDFGDPRSTARGWRGAAPTVVAVWMWRTSQSRNSERRSSSSDAASRSSRRCSASCWPCSAPPGFASPESVCRTDAPKLGSCARAREATLSALRPQPSHPTDGFAAVRSATSRTLRRQFPRK